MKGIRYKTMAIVLVFAILAGNVGMTSMPAAAAKKVRLKDKTLKVVVGKTVKVKLLHNKKKVKWTVKSGKKRIAIQTKKKKFAVVKGKKAGVAKVQAKIGKKKFVCKVIVKKASNATSTSGKSTPKLPNYKGTPFTVEQDNYQMTGVKSLKGAVKIPATFTYNGVQYKVTKLGDSLFAGNEDVTSVEIPDSVTEIGNEVFLYASALSKVTIPVSVRSIGNSVFEDCSSLTNITLPDSVTSIGTNVFKNSALIVINLPRGLTRLSDGMFWNCMGVVNLTIPNNVRYIGKNVFEGFGASGYRIKWRGKTYTDTDELEKDIWHMGVVVKGNN